MGCVSSLPAPSYQQSEKFTRALRRKLRPSDAAPAHAFLDPAISDPVFGFGSEAGRLPKGRSRVAIGEGAERRVIRRALLSSRPACVPQGMRSPPRPSGSLTICLASSRRRQVQGIVEQRQPDQVIRAEHGHAVSCAGLRS